MPLLTSIDAINFIVPCYRLEACWSQRALGLLPFMVQRWIRTTATTSTKGWGPNQPVKYIRRWSASRRGVQDCRRHYTCPANAATTTANHYEKPPRRAHATTWQRSFCRRVVADDFYPPPNTNQSSTIGCTYINLGYYFRETQYY